MSVTGMMTMRMHRLMLMAGCGLFLSALPCSAADPHRPGKAEVVLTVKDRLAQCVEEMDRAHRLQCYDDVAVEQGVMEGGKRDQERKIMGNFGFWNVIVKTTEMLDNKVYLKLAAKDYEESRTGYRRRPELVIRCQERTTDLYVDWKAILTNASRRYAKLYINYKFDGGPMAGAEWEYSLDRYSIFAPNAVDLIKIMKDKKAFAVELTPYGETAQMVVFELEGLPAALDVLIKECYGDTPEKMPGSGIPDATKSPLENPSEDLP